MRIIPKVSKKIIESRSLCVLSGVQLIFSAMGIIYLDPECFDFRIGKLKHEVRTFTGKQLKASLESIADKWGYIWD